MPPSWLLWLMVLWQLGKFAFFLFAIGAKIWQVTRATSSGDRNE